MTKEITKAYILQQIQDKFGLRELDPEVFSFLETVIPTYNIEQHLQTHEVAFEDKSISSGPGGFLFFFVPDSERWTLRGYNIVFMAAGAYTVTGLYLRRQAYDMLIYLDMTLGQTVSYNVNLPYPVILEPGSKIYVYIDSYTSTADLRVYIDYMKEVVR